MGLIALAYVYVYVSLYSLYVHGSAQICVLIRLHDTICLRYNCIVTILTNHEMLCKDHITHVSPLPVMASKAIITRGFLYPVSYIP
jgi:hypothetical protein